MEVSRTFVLLILVSLEVGGPLAAMEAGGGFLQVNKMSSTIKPCYPSALLPLLLPGPWCGKAPSPIRSSRERGAGSSPRCSARPAAHRLRRRRGQRGRALPRGVGARPVPGDPVHLGVPLGPPRDAGVHGDDVQQGEAGRRRLLQGTIDVRRRPRLSSDNGSLRASNIPRGRPKAGKATRGADGAFATPKPILPDIEATSINELPRAHDDTKRRRRQHKSGSLCCACRAPANRRLIWRRQALLPTPPTTTTPAMRPANPSDSMRASLAVFLGDFLGGGCLVPCCGAHLHRCGPGCYQMHRMWPSRGVMCGGGAAVPYSRRMRRDWLLPQPRLPLLCGGASQLCIGVCLLSGGPWVFNVFYYIQMVALSLRRGALEGYRYELLLPPATTPTKTTPTKSFGCRNVSPSTAPPTRSSPSHRAVSPSGCTRL